MNSTAGYPYTTAENINEYNATIYSFLFYTKMDELVITVLLPIIFVIGVLGNCAVVIVFYRVKTMRTVTNCYLIALSIADFTFLISAIPMFWVSYLNSPVPDDIADVSIIYCKLSLYTSDVSFIVSCLLILMVTVERYLAINWSLQSKRLSTKKRAIVHCWAVWIIVIIYKIPDLFFVTLSRVPLDREFVDVPTDFPLQVSFCMYCNLGNETEECTNFRKALILEGILPLLEIVPITILYTMVIIKLKRHCNFTLPRQLTNGHSSRICLRRETQVTRLLMVTVFVFVICVTPFQMLHIIPEDLLQVINDKLPHARNIAKILLYINSAINPILYNLVCGNFRQAFKKVFTGFCLMPYQCTHQFKSSTREIHLELKS
ncbi:neuromedin-U receptor 2-like [Amphiura filiformis]|uniref:neuromedin-U receptor 2-like n=1 Tax=Amphiura filiformis TaxID=82378 RepID=UPI003B213693